MRMSQHYLFPTVCFQLHPNPESMCLSLFCQNNHINFILILSHLFLVFFVDLSDKVVEK